MRPANKNNHNLLVFTHYKTVSHLREMIREITKLTFLLGESWLELPALLLGLSWNAEVAVSAMATRFAAEVCGGGDDDEALTAAGWDGTVTG